MMRLARLIRIQLIALRFGLDEFVLGHARVRGLRPFVNRVLFWVSVVIYAGAVTFTYAALWWVRTQS